MSKTLNIDGAAFVYDDANAVGHGSFFTVYQGSEVNDSKKQVAIKVHRTDKSKYAEASFDGYRKQAWLNQSDLFPTVHAIIDKEQIIIEEWVEGEVLRDRLIQLKAMELTDRLHYMKRLALGLHFMHSMGITHRDLHSANIKVDLDKRALKILDFNTAKAPSDARATSDSPGERIWGYYKDPSLHEGDIYDAKSDIYSLGVIFAEILIGTTVDQIAEIPKRGTARVLAALQSHNLGTNSVYSIVESMLANEGISRPNALAIVNALEIGKPILVEAGSRLMSRRETGFSFMRKVGSRLEIFIRRRDIQKLALLPRAQVDLMIMPHTGTQEEYLLLAPRRFIDANEIVLFTELSLPNVPGVMNELVFRLSPRYKVLDIQTVECFQHHPEARLFITIGTDKEVSHERVDYYLNPLKQYLTRVLFHDICDYIKSLKDPKAHDTLTKWLSVNTYEDAVNVTSSLKKQFKGRIVNRQRARGYLSSATHSDPTHETYSVIKGLEISDRVPQFDKLGRDEFILFKTISDSKQKDMVLKKCSANLHLARIQVRSLLPIDCQPQFLPSMTAVLDDTIRIQSPLPWNIESFEITDAIISWNDDNRVSVRLSVYMTCEPEHHDIPQAEYDRIRQSLLAKVKKLNGDAIEV